MKLPDYKDAPSAGTFNVFTFLAISLTWGHMLGLINLWFLPLTVLCVVVGYGSELGAITKPETLTIEQSLEL